MLTELNFFVTVTVLVFFAGEAWLKLARVAPDWVQVVTGVAAALLAVVALLSLF